MALIECRECHNTVSNQAKTCPHCGAKVSESKLGWRWLVYAVAIAIFMVIVIGYLINSSQELDTYSKGIIKPEDQKQTDIVQTLKEGLTEKCSAKCTSVTVIEESKNHFVGEAVLDNGRKLDVTASMDGEVVRYTYQVKSGYEYKCKHHIGDLRLFVYLPDDENLKRSCLYGEVWNDENEPIRGFIIAEFIDDKDRIYKRYHGITCGTNPFDWISPGENAKFFYSFCNGCELPLDSLRGEYIKIRLEFFNLAEQPLASIDYDDFDKNALEWIPAKVNSQIYEIKTEKISEEKWEQLVKLKLDLRYGKDKYIIQK